MNRYILFLLLIVAASAHSQSACEQLGVDCRHPQIDQKPTCDAQCIQERRERGREQAEARQKAWEDGKAARDQAEFEERVRKEREQEARLQAKANKIADEGYEYEKKGNCSKALDYYLKAAKVVKPWTLLNRATARCQDDVGDYDAAYANFELVINSKDTPDSDVYKLRLAEWAIMYHKGYVCPYPPRFNGLVDCYRRLDHLTRNVPYVPLPIIEGKSWTPKALRINGPFTIITKDGHTWNITPSNINDVLNINMLDARIQVPNGNAISLLLPDDTTFQVGPNSDITLDSFVYDPNTSNLSATMQVIKGVFRFVTGKLSHVDPMNRQIKFIGPSSRPQNNEPVAVDAVGIRGSDVEIDFGDGADPIHTGWKWIHVYDGDVTYTGYDGVARKIPVGTHLSVPSKDSIVKIHDPVENDPTDNNGKPGLSTLDSWNLDQPPIGRQ